MTCNMYLYLKYLGNLLEVVGLSTYTTVYTTVMREKLPELHVVHVKGSFHIPSNRTFAVKVEVIFSSTIAKTGFKKVNSAQI